MWIFCIPLEQGHDEIYVNYNEQTIQSNLSLLSLSHIRLKLSNMFDIRHYTKKTCFRKCCFYSISFSFLRKCLGRCRHSFRFSWYTKEGKQIDVDKWYIFATQTMSKALKLAKLVLRHSFLRGSCKTMESFTYHYLAESTPTHITNDHTYELKL